MSCEYTNYLYKLLPAQEKSCVERNMFQTAWADSTAPFTSSCART